MKTNRVFSIFIATALIATAIFVAQSAIATFTIYAKAKDFLSANTDAARWQALGQYYAKQDAALNFSPLHIRDISAQRWEAMGQAYANAVSPARQADLARWVGLGELYSSLGASTNAAFDAQRIRDNDAARLQAMGQAYANAVSPARQADLARWVGLGEVYSTLTASANAGFDAQRVRNNDAARLQAMGQAYANVLSPARQADLARWVAMGEYYSKLNGSTGVVAQSK